MENRTHRLESRLDFARLTSPVKKRPQAAWQHGKCYTTSMPASSAFLFNQGMLSSRRRLLKLSKSFQKIAASATRDLNTLAIASRGTRGVDVDKVTCTRLRTARPSTLLQRPWTYRLVSGEVPPIAGDGDNVVSEDDLKLAVDAVQKDADSSNMGFTDIPGSRKGGGKRLAMIYTCNVCQTRSAKQFTEQAYNHGVVLVRCPSCKNLHLIADRLGFFEEESWDVETALAKKGDTVKTVTGEDVLELTLNDVVGDGKLQEAIKQQENQQQEDEGQELSDLSSEEGTHPSDTQ